MLPLEVAQGCVGCGLLKQAEVALIRWGHNCRPSLGLFHLSDVSFDQNCISRQSRINDLSSMTTTLVTATRASAKGSSNPTSDLNPSLPTTSAAPVATKTELANCNVQGTPSSGLTSNILDRAYAAGPTSCQLLGMYRSRCESCSFQQSTSTSAKNCVFCSTYINGSKVSCSSGIYFSDKYPEDGSNFCYGSTEL